MKEFAEVFINSLKVKILQKNSSYGNFFHRELFVWNLLYFTTDIVIFLPVDGRLPCREPRHAL